MPNTIEIREYRSSQWDEVEPVWRTLVEEAPDASFFLSAEWTGSWLTIFGDCVHTTILVFLAERKPVGAALIARRSQRRAMLPVSRVFLNTAGEDPADETCIEFNDVLCSPGWREQVSDALVSWLGRLDWHELVLQGFVDGDMSRSLASRLDGEAQTERRTSSYVDLEALRAENRTYVSVLRSRTRTYVRENLRLYGERGPITVEPAGSPEHALSLLERMADLHQQSWVARSQPGAFSSRRFFAFQRMLVRTAFDRGGILLLHVSAGAKTVGILYNFVWRGKVLFYQSGFNYESDKRTKPGLLTFAMAIQHCAEAGFSEFDFLAGGDHYKRDLSTGGRELLWMTIRRPSLVTAALGLLSRCRTALLNVIPVLSLLTTWCVEY